FRFGNNLFEHEWSNEIVEAINIRLHESIGAEDRGSFYENVGALRDVGQNHLLQMLALVTMERPHGYGPDGIRAARAELLERLRIPTVKEAAAGSFRAQYEGYRKADGVAPDSEVETYFRVRGYLTGARWEGVPVAMESGKRLGKPLKEIEILLRHEMPCVCEGKVKHQNRITIHLEPKEGITITFIAKKPGHAPGFEERTLNFDFREGGPHAQYTEEYEKLILDCVAGDQTLFVSSGEVRAMWRFIDPFIAAWGKGMVTLHSYQPDSAAIAAEAAVLDETRRLPAGPAPLLHKEIGIYGLGKMGANLARNLRDRGWRVVVANRSPEPVARLEAEGFAAARSVDEFLEKLGSGARKPGNRIIWLMVTAGKPVDELILGLAGRLARGDVVIDGGNSFFEDSMRRAKLLAKRGIKFLDAGVSGGPAGARDGACMMVGGDRRSFAELEQLFADASVRGGYAYFGSAGAGHFVKMVHNGIEYGMMQSIAEGFALMKHSPFRLDLGKVARLYNHGSVIESRLVGWLESGYRQFGGELKGVSGSVAYTGEGEWTVATGRKWKMKLPAIEDAFRFRVRSQKEPGYMGRILSVLRNQFGGHSIDRK
ncbi:MAG TPA: decarboxylating 6-phosphogluconate dehydrogenase, partial [Candidatus Paceibacterota bacterium]|nr:decarboxylating 6-phosphogluconate dehydrogenase [Candidatus Paceibacterota bacterium]